MLSHLLAFAINLAQPAAATETAIEGRWRNPTGSVIISIAPCGQWLCGRVDWASDKASADARRGGTDPLVGAQLLSEIVPKGETRWKARLFVPDLNKNSRAELRLVGVDQLKVTGCVIGRVACKSQIWARTEPE